MAASWLSFTSVQAKENKMFFKNKLMELELLVVSNNLLCLLNKARAPDKLMKILTTLTQNKAEKQPTDGSQKRRAG